MTLVVVSVGRFHATVDLVSRVASRVDTRKRDKAQIWDQNKQKQEKTKK